MSFDPKLVSVNLLENPVVRRKRIILFGYIFYIVVARKVYYD